MEDTGDKPFLRALLRNHRPPYQAHVVTVPEDADYDVIQCKSTMKEVRYSTPEEERVQQKEYESVTLGKTEHEPAQSGFGKVGKGEEEPDTIKSKIPIPDLNSSMAVSSTIAIDSCMVNEIEGRKTLGGENEKGAKYNEDIDKEIKATFEMGHMLGINLRNKEGLVRSTIQGDWAIKGSP
ncbi:hypothetical protein L1987_42997 [Smallanthus sonchifolius]|uniref:Uncharacterized protein n=1 Tax=Smallanthus sonchifolius TaxID=185202 RepID=A0ACB9GKB3_9ASTR|nr:hypothetical protein L1987_42997 [Smallanthus sonchifolius]